MQKITRDQLIEKASSLLADGTVGCRRLHKKHNPG